MAVLLPGAAPRRARAEALRAARAHRRRRDDRLVLRQHVRHAGRLPLLPRPRRARALRQVRSSTFIDRVADGYAASLRRVLPFRAGRSSAACAVLARRGGVGGGALAEHVLPRDRRVDGAHLRPPRAGHLAGRRRPARSPTMGKTLAGRAARRGTSSWCSPTSGSPNNARSAMTSPNDGPHMGFIRLALVDPEKRKLSQREIAGPDARRSWSSTIPGVEFLQWPGGLVASVFANGYIAPLVVEVRSDNLAELDEQAKAVAEVARTVPGVRDVRVSLPERLPGDPRGHQARRGGHGRVSAREPRRRPRSTRRSATSTPRASGSTRTTASRTTS